MEVTSYLLGKKAGGGGITPSGTISITENGEANVTNYATANVNVQPDLESKSVTITENTTTTITPTSGKDGLSSVAITTNVSGGGVVEKDVNLWDYDGTLLYSYTKTELAQLTEWPANPTHDGLTAQGWNWTLSDAKAFMQSQDFLDIGQWYQPTDEKLHIFITLGNKYKTPYLCFAINGTATIEWGDGTSENVTGNSTSTLIATQHTYLASGDYEIKISSSAIINLMGSLAYGSHLLTNSDSPGYSNPYLKAIKKIYLSNTTKCNNYSLMGLGKLKEVVLEKNQSYSNYIFQNCSSLKCAVMPFNVSTGQSMFTACTNLEIFCSSKRTGSSLASVETNTLQSCSSLKRVSFQGTYNNAIFPFSGVEKVAYITTSTGQPAEEGCYKIKKYKMSNSVTSINSKFGNQYYSCDLFDFRDFTSVPTLSSSTFAGITLFCRIVVPDNLWSDWSTANRWVGLATSGNLIKASDYEE